VDSVSGTITRTYDNLDRLKTETTPLGSIAYTYDAASHRTNMTVAGQPTVTYTYDIANKLTQIAQGSSTVVYAYDNTNRLSYCPELRL
jgi:YD repeat-containing protein